jgi:hypothetical protein
MSTSAYRQIIWSVNIPDSVEPVFHSQRRSRQFSSRRPAARDFVRDSSGSSTNAWSVIRSRSFLTFRILSPSALMAAPLRSGTSRRWLDYNLAHTSLERPFTRLETTRRNFI